MKFLRQNIRSMITVAVFAILAAIVEGSFACNYGFESRQENGFADAAFGKVEAPDNPLFLSRETGAETGLLTRRPDQQAFSRTLRSGNFQGPCGRDTGAFRRTTSLSGSPIAAPSIAVSGFPTPLAYQTSKEYYVFTLERILC